MLIFGLLSSALGILLLIQTSSILGPAFLLAGLFALLGALIKPFIFPNS